MAGGVITSDKAAYRHLSLSHNVTLTNLRYFKLMVPPVRQHWRCMWPVVSAKRRGSRAVGARVSGK